MPSRSKTDRQAVVRNVIALGPRLVDHDSTLSRVPRRTGDRSSGVKSHDPERPLIASTQHLLDSWAKVVERLRSAVHVALFLDFDGTLAPFRLRPEAVTLSHSTRRVLQGLVCHPRVSVFLLSGRRRADVENRVRVAGIGYLGLHGWEGRKAAVPKAVVRGLLATAKRQLQDRLAGLRSVWIEEKGPVFTVHVRGASPRTARKAGTIVREVMTSCEPHLRVLPGNQVWEVVPGELEGKGAAVRTLLRNMPAATLPIYLGDDTTDESAFTVLPEGITVCVGDRHPTKARFGLRGPREVRRFLEKMERELREISRPTLPVLGCFVSTANQQSEGGQPGGVAEGADKLQR